MEVLKKTDLARVRAANMKIVTNGDSTPLDISRASQVIIRIKALEMHAGPKYTPITRVKPLEAEEQIDSLSHLRVVRM